jgi:2-polyprenyl-3-methyl-5-hydroxy-6-metoxy-1,4-benzoquinol methylase
MSANQPDWEKVYQTKAFDTVSWYAPHLETSLRLIERVAPDRSAAVIDVGGGQSTLVDDLLAKGYRQLTVLDLSVAAIEFAKKRLGSVAAAAVNWRVADITEVDLPERCYEVWHDRAVFHFLTEPAQRQAYVRQLLRSLKTGGHAIVATFGPQGPLKCSGLDVVRYDAQALHQALGQQFELIDSQIEQHKTPTGAEQQFVYCLCRLKPD